jgi:superfamily II DNA/RNA helicase
VVATLRSVFPHIVKPTKTQARLIPAILSGKDVLLKDHTGTGKYVETHISVDVQHASDKSTELQVIWLNLGLA